MRKFLYLSLFLVAALAALQVLPANEDVGSENTSWNSFQPGEEPIRSMTHPAVWQSSQTTRTSRFHQTPAFMMIYGGIFAAAALMVVFLFIQKSAAKRTISRDNRTSFKLFEPHDLMRSWVRPANVEWIDLDAIMDTPLPVEAAKYLDELGITAQEFTPGLTLAQLYGPKETRATETIFIGKHHPIQPISQKVD